MLRVDGCGDPGAAGDRGVRHRICPTRSDSSLKLYEKVSQIKAWEIK